MDLDFGEQPEGLWSLHPALKPSRGEPWVPSEWPREDLWFIIGIDKSIRPLNLSTQNRTIDDLIIGGICFDTATLLTLVTPLAAPAGSSAISPLSTLLVFAPPGVSRADMARAIMAGFSIPSNFVIGTSDAYQEYSVKKASLVNCARIVVKPPLSSSWTKELFLSAVDIGQIPLQENARTLPLCPTALMLAALWPIPSSINPPSSLQTPNAFILVRSEQLVASVVVQTAYMLAEKIQDVPTVN